MNATTTVILGGGQGSRLMPLTKERSKPAVGFGGKYRIIDLAISNCINSGLKRIYVLTQFLSASLHNHIMQAYRFDHFTNGFVDILAAEQTPSRSDWFQGTADAVRATLHHITYQEPENVLILAGDHLYRMDYREMLAFHSESDADITCAVHPISRAEAPRMGLLAINEDYAITEFQEKPQDPALIERFRVPEGIHLAEEEAGQDHYLASMGIYVFKTKVLKKLLQNPEEKDFGGQVIPGAIGQCRMQAWPFNGYWKDIGTIRAYYEENIGLAQPNADFELYAPNWPIYTRARSLPPCRIIGSEILDSLLVEGADIKGAHIADSVIGTRSHIAEGSRLNGVVMLGADGFDGEIADMTTRYAACRLPRLGVGRNCVIENAILDKNVRIGDGVVIRAKTGCEYEEGEYHWVRDGIVIVPKDTSIPPGTQI